MVGGHSMNMPRPPKSDRAIQNEVLDALNRDARLLPAEVGVVVRDGIVTLAGTVSSHETAAIAADIAISAADVCDVANALIVAGDGQQHDDTKTARTIRHAFGWNAAVPTERVDVIVRKGVVILRGSVDHWYARKAAESTAAGVAGVASVHNEIQLTAPPASDDILQEEVEDALSRLPACGDVDVRVTHGVVTLAGEIGSGWLSHQVETVAASSLGVHGVHNELRTRR